MHEQPLPAGEAARAAERVQDPAGQRAADDAGDRDADHEPRGHARATVGRIPVRQVEDDAGEEAGLGDAEQEAHDIERRRAGDEHHAARQDAPRDHDPRDPDPRADAMQDDVARDLEDEVADEEDAGAEAEHGVAELQVAEHLQLREPDVDAVEVVRDVADHQERDEAPADLAIGRLLERRRRPVAVEREGCGHRCLRCGFSCGRHLAGRGVATQEARRRRRRCAVAARVRRSGRRRPRGTRR